MIYMRDEVHDHSRMDGRRIEEKEKVIKEKIPPSVL
jgi:hypothetical protein